MLASHEDLASILINGFLGVSSRRDILYHNSMVDVVVGVTRIIEEGVIEEVLNAL